MTVRRATSPLISPSCTDLTALRPEACTGRFGAPQTKKPVLDMHMLYRKPGASALDVSVICLGTMTFGGRTDETTATEIVAKARACGVNFIDTADAYGEGTSEEITGRAIASDRDRWVLATKVGNQIGQGVNRKGLSRKWLFEALEGSLKRLGTE